MFPRAAGPCFRLLSRLHAPRNDYTLLWVRKFPMGPTTPSHEKSIFAWREWIVGLGLFWKIVGEVFDDDDTSMEFGTWALS